MKCPECVENGEKSRVFCGPATTTCMAVISYYDEDGKFVIDAPHIRTTSYSCSNGHSSCETTQREETTITRSNQT